MTTYKLNADERTIKGRKVKNLRKEGLVPANVFGKKISSFMISVNRDEFKKLFRDAGETSIIELTVGKKTSPVLISDVQVSPIDDENILHIDFLQVDLKEKVKATVPVILEGEAPAQKMGLGTLVQLIDEVDVEALPSDLPEHLVADVSKIETLEDVVYVKDLKFDKSKVEVENDAELIVAQVQEAEEEVNEPVETSEEAAEAPKAAEAISEEENTQG